MIEKIYNMTLGNDKTIERIIQDENIHYNHMILNKGERLPEHYSNAIVYMTVLRGRLSIELDNQPVHVYEKGSILNIPSGIKMNVKNLHDEVLELTVIKAPAPTNV